MSAAPEPEADLLHQQAASVLDHVKDACAIVDAQGRFLFVNRSGEALSRKSRHELLGRTIEEVFPILAGTPILQAISQAAAQGETIRFEQFYPDAHVWLEGEAHPVAGGASIILRNIADRKHLAEELQNIADNLPVIVSHIDSDLRIRRLNQAYEEFYGASAAAMVGKLLSEAAGEPHFSIAQPYIERALRGERVSFESCIRHRDGTLHDVQAIYNPRRKEDGSSDGFLAVVIDINDRKKLEREREHLMHQLSTERARLAAIFESFPAGVAFAEAASGEITYVNRQVEHILGEPVTSAQGDAAYQSVLARAVAGEAIENQEVRYQRPDGRPVWIRLSGAPILDQDSVVVGGLVVFYDIDRERTAMEALRQRENEVATLLNNIPDIIARHDRDLRCVLASPSVERHTGVPPKFFVGRKNSDLGLPAAVVRQWDESLLRIFRTGDMDWNEFSVEGPKGLRHFNSIGVPEFGPDGKVATVLTITHDVTQRKLTLEALRENEERLHVAMETARLGAWELNLVNGRMECSAQCKANFGIDANSPFTYADFIASIDAADRPLMQAAVDHAIASHTDFRAEFKTFWPDGTAHWVLASGRALYEEDRPVRMVGVTLDTTERKQAEEALTRQAEELARSNADLQQFAYVTSHDLQEPLRTITSFAQMLMLRHKDQLDSDANEFLEYIVAGAKRMKGLIDALLTYSRVVNSEAAPLSAVQLDAAVQWAKMNLQLIIEESHATITHDELPSIQADNVQLVQLFQNLIGNAIKYSRPGVPPVIHIGASRRKDDWLIEVRDNGLGIAAQHTERIFGVFKRLHGKDTPGTGIGLAICKKIVEKHGGRIWVESQPGNGSRFCFTLQD